MQAKVIDFQAHFAPPSYIDVLAKRTEIPFVKKVGETYLFRYGPGSQYPITKKSYDIRTKLEAMDNAGVEAQILSIIIPGAEILDLKTGIDLARIVNDETAEVVRQYPERFTALTTLPLRDTEASLKELDRATNSLGFKGIMFFSNVDGMPLSDPKLWPIYEMAQELDQPILIHPTRPVMADEVKEYGLEIIVGFMFDTSLAALKLIFSGVLERYPKLKIIVPHAGGILPYLLGRIDYQSSLIPGSRDNLKTAPSDYIKKFYTDTVSMSGPALEYVYNLLGPEHLLFATDYPYWEMVPSVELIKQMDIPEEHKEGIFYKNAKRLLKLE
jgi:predicted TIM-barrel fold metal-dependent hydrolase